MKLLVMTSTDCGMLMIGVLVLVVIDVLFA